MTKKDYIKIAGAFKSRFEYLRANATDPSIKQAQISGLQTFTCDIANVLANDNPNFNRTKFYEACDYND